MRAIESEIRLKGKQVAELESEIGNREKSQAEYERDKAKYVKDIENWQKEIAKIGFDESLIERYREDHSQVERQLKDVEADMSNQ